MVRSSTSLRFFAAGRTLPAARCSYSRTRAPADFHRVVKAAGLTFVKFAHVLLELAGGLPLPAIGSCIALLL